MRKIISILVLVVLFTGSQRYVFGGGVTIEISDIEPGDFVTFGFHLDEDKKIQIEAVGAGGEKEIHKVKENYEDPSNMYAYAWIINSKTRKLAWKGLQKLILKLFFSFLST